VNLKTLNEEALQYLFQIRPGMAFFNLGNLFGRTLAHNLAGKAYFGTDDTVIDLYLLFPKLFKKLKITFIF